MTAPDTIQKRPLTPHMVCISGKKIDEFSGSILDEREIPEETKEWGLIKSRHRELRGICHHSRRK